MANAKAKVELSQEDIAAKIAEIDANNVVTLQTRNAKIDAIWARVDELGVNAALGSTSVYELSILFQDSVRDGFIASTDNVRFYQRYFDTVKEKLKANALKAGKEGLSQNSFDGQCSKLKSFGMAAAVHLGESLYQAIDRVWLDLPKEVRAASMSASYSRINTRANDLLKKDCKGSLSKLEEIVFKTNWLEVNLCKEAKEEKTDETDETDEKAESNKTPLDKLGDISAAITKLSKKGFEDNAEFAAFAAYVASYHAKMVKASHGEVIAPSA